MVPAGMAGGFFGVLVRVAFFVLATWVVGAVVSALAFAACEDGSCGF